MGTRYNQFSSIPQAPGQTGAVELATTGAPVSGAAAAPPTVGQVPTATSPTAYAWQTPYGGLSVRQYTYTDTINGVIGPLTIPTLTLSNVLLHPIDGILQQYGIDFTIRSVTGGSAPGYYVCIDPMSTAPGGGSFSGGSNPSVTDLYILLEDGDVVQVIC